MNEKVIKLADVEEVCDFVRAAGMCDFDIDISDQPGVNRNPIYATAYLFNTFSKERSSPPYFTVSSFLMPSPITPKMDLASITMRWSEISISKSHMPAARTKSHTSIWKNQGKTWKNA